MLFALQQTHVYCLFYVSPQQVLSGVLRMVHTASKSVRFVGGAFAHSIDSVTDALAATIVNGIEMVEHHAEKAKRYAAVDQRITLQVLCSRMPWR
jgi:hypothetical protein